MSSWKKCVIAFPEFEGVVRTVQGIQSAIKLNREKSLRIISVLEEMSHQDDVHRIVSLMNVLIILSSSGTDSVVGTKQNEDKERERIDNIRTYVICNAVRDISLDDIAKHVGMNRSSFCVFFKKIFWQDILRISERISCISRSANAVRRQIEHF